MDRTLFLSLFLEFCPFWLLLQLRCFPPGYFLTGGGLHHTSEIWWLISFIPTSSLQGEGDLNSGSTVAQLVTKIIWNLFLIWVERPIIPLTKMHSQNLTLKWTQFNETNMKLIMKTKVLFCICGKPWVVEMLSFDEWLLLMIPKELTVKLNFPLIFIF